MTQVADKDRNSLARVKALTFDTGGTVLDWHSGIRSALSATGERHGLVRDWAAITNTYRRRSLQRMTARSGRRSTSTMSTAATGGLSHLRGQRSQLGSAPCLSINRLQP